MINLFLGFSGRLRRRDFVLWSILVPIVLILPPALGAATTATSLKTSLSQDLAAAGLLWHFFALIVLMNYVSVALFWKRLNDVDQELQRRSAMGFLRWGYALLTATNTLVICLAIIARGEIDGSAGGWVLAGLWAVACRNRPHQGPNDFGPDPRDRSRLTENDVDAPSSSALRLDAALQRAVDERRSMSESVSSTKSARSPVANLSAKGVKPGFGKRA